MRKKGREAAFQIIFAEFFNDGLDGKFSASVYKKLGLDEDGIAYAERLLHTVKENREALTKTLSDHVVRFADYRVYPADRAILLLALAEIFYFEDVPNVVSVNEAVGLARVYSTENSVNFVNGVLGGVINDAH